MEGAKKICFLHFKCKYFAIYAIQVSKISSTNYYTSLVQDIMVRYAKRKEKIKNFAPCNRMTFLSVF